MQIIKSTYNSKELFELYDREEAKVNHKLAKIINNLSQTLLFLFCAICLFAVIYIDRSQRFSVNTKDIMVLAIGLIFVIYFLTLLIKEKALIHNVRNYYINKGEVLENPLSNYWYHIDFIEEGEDLLEELQKYPNAELMVNDDELLIIQRNERTGDMEVKGDYLLNRLTCGIVEEEKFISNGVLNFSLCDKEIEEILKKAGDV